VTGYWPLAFLLVPAVLLAGRVWVWARQRRDRRYPVPPRLQEPVSRPEPAGSVLWDARLGEWEESA
jgi:hypothetical protein